jgi:hypothetical protein
VKRAVNGPSRAPVITKLTISGEPVGMPAVIIEREFAEVIGHVGGKACKILRIIVDFTGRPQTAVQSNDSLGRE